MISHSHWLVKLLISEGYGGNAAVALAEKILDALPVKAITDAALSTAMDQHRANATPIAGARNIIQSALCALTEAA